jgi:hypothetical protein
MESQEQKKESITNADENSASQPKQEEHHHGIMEVIEEAISQLNTEFPLSGGEPNEEIISPEEVVAKEHLNSNFPLSGGDAE